eukprot:251005-Rhodomonas_salina.1
MPYWTKRLRLRASPAENKQLLQDKLCCGPLPCSGSFCSVEGEQERTERLGEFSRQRSRRGDKLRGMAGAGHRAQRSGLQLAPSCYTPTPFALSPREPTRVVTVPRIPRLEGGDCCYWPIPALGCQMISQYRGKHLIRPAKRVPSSEILHRLCAIQVLMLVTLAMDCMLLCQTVPGFHVSALAVQLCKCAVGTRAHRQVTSGCESNGRIVGEGCISNFAPPNRKNFNGSAVGCGLKKAEFGGHGTIFTNAVKLAKCSLLPYGYNELLGRLESVTAHSFQVPFKRSREVLIHPPHRSAAQDGPHKRLPVVVAGLCAYIHTAHFVIGSPELADFESKAEVGVESQATWWGRRKTASFDVLDGLGFQEYPHRTIRNATTVIPRFNAASSSVFWH